MGVFHVTNETLQHLHLGAAWALSLLTLGVIVRVLAECIRLARQEAPRDERT